LDHKEIIKNYIKLNKYINYMSFNYYKLTNVEKQQFIEEITISNNENDKKINPNIGFTKESYYFIPNTNPINIIFKDFIKDTWEKVSNTITESDLIIRRYINGDLDPLITDFSIIGLVKKEPDYNKGRKSSAIYMDNDGRKVVEKNFTDIRDTSTNRLLSLEMTIDWYQEDGNIGLTKTEICKNFSISQSKTEERKRRERQIDYLEALVEGTPIEDAVTTIITKYQDDITKYIQFGITKNLMDSMKGETDPTLNTVLNDIYLPIVGLPQYKINTIQTIEFQIGVKTMEEIIAENVDHHDD
tara:strand:- start:244 stop:1143 length:900 start_codon:yes stop_codon:yes gene_type:complete